MSRISKAVARALRILLDDKEKHAGNRHRWGLWPSAFARLMWPDSPSWERYSNVGCGATTGVGITRRAGAFLWKLQEEGLACHWDTEHHQHIFYITGEGEKALAEYRGEKGGGSIV